MEDETPYDAAGEPVDHSADQSGMAPVEPTGHPGVDSVLGSLEGIEEREVHEHVAVFEQAHGALRRALDDPGTAPDESGVPQD